MKGLKVILPLVLVVLLAFSWFNTVKEITKNNSNYDDYIKSAQESLDEGLYEQAVEFYRQSLDYKDSEDTYFQIKNVYEKYYEEEHTADVRSIYIGFLEEAREKYSKEAEFYLKEADLYKEAENYPSAYKCVKRAKQLGVKNDNVDKVYDELRYMTFVEQRLYNGVKTALNGSAVLFDGEYWKLVNGEGKSYSKSKISAEKTYTSIGVLSDDKYAIYSKGKDTRLLDGNGVTRARFDLKIDDVGCYDSETGYVPVCIEGKWSYLNKDSGLGSNKYDFAGSFINGKAGVCENGKWYVIDKDMNKVSDRDFEDIRLDLYGRYVQGNVVIAKEQGKYHLYDENLKQKSDFSCDDIDICINKQNIAFEQDGKWGYVDTDGKIVISPKYKKARSFSNDLAGVSNDDGKWGYIDTNDRLVINYEYEDALYFNSNGRSFIVNSDGAYQILRFLL